MTSNNSGPGYSPAADLPAYPIHVIPGPAGKLCKGLACHTCLPAEMFLLPFLAAVSATIGTGLKVRFTEQWEEYPMVWTALVAPSGTGKSPALQNALKAFRALEASRIREGRSLLLEANDTTVEGLCLLLSLESRGVLVVHDELPSLVEKMNTYNRSDDLRFYLASWATGPYKKLRVGAQRVKTGKPQVLVIENAFVAVTGSIQPKQLPRFAPKGSEGTGFLERFLWAISDVELPPALPTPFPGAEALEHELIATFEHLRELEPTVGKLSTQARQSFSEWYEFNSDQLVAQLDDERRVLRDKMSRQVLRLGLVLHALDHGGEAGSKSVQSRSIKGAIELAEYHLAHGEEALRLASRRSGPAGGSSNEEIEARILQFLCQRADRVSKTELHEFFGRNLKAERLDAALARLLSSGSIELQRKGGKVGAPTVCYRAIVEQ